MSKEIIQDRSIDLTGVGGIKFSEAEHTYHNIDGVKYTGITTLLGNYHEHFDNQRTAINKAIKDCVIEDSGYQWYNQIKDEPNAVTVIKDELKGIPPYVKEPILNEVIKTSIIKSAGEDKYMLFEKQVKGFNNLHTQAKMLMKKRPEVFKEVHALYNEKGSVTQVGLRSYKELTKKYNGFNNLLNGLDDIRLKDNVLYDKILVKRDWLIQEWIDINLKAITEGTIEHDRREQEIYDDGGYEWEGTFYKYVEGKNISNVTLDDVIVIPECMVWNHKMKLGGLADIFLFDKGVIRVLDYKTNASIDLDTKFKKFMTGPCSSLLDLNFYHYSLQLKIYQRMAMITRPEFSAGENIIIHTTSVSHYRDVDAFFTCHEVDAIVNDIFKELLNV